MPGENDDQTFDTEGFYLGPSTMDLDMNCEDDAGIDAKGGDSQQLAGLVRRSSLIQSIPLFGDDGDGDGDEARPVAGTSSYPSRDQSGDGPSLSTSDLCSPPVKIPPTDDNFLAFGTIRLVSESTVDNSSPTGKPRCMIRGKFRDVAYPHPAITAALKKGSIRLEELSTPQSEVFSYLRVYILPEDANRANWRNSRDFQKIVKWLLDFVDCSIEAWNGQANATARPVTYDSLVEGREESLFYIFNTLKSPDPNPDLLDPTSYGYQAVGEALENNILGLKTLLYPYQCRSVAAMVQKEAAPAKFCDARKLKFQDLSGHPFYLDPHEGVLLKDPPLYTEPQGGILAETMGYGKTLICIALILATRGHYPRIPEGRVDSFSYEPRKKVGTLLQMAARRTKHEGLPWKNEFAAYEARGYHFNTILEELSKYERAYAEPIFTPTTPGRKGKRESFNVVRLCSATLVIVPTNLLVQWQQEIQKHVDESLLNILVVDSQHTPVPAWEKLLECDVVLMTKSRFEQEYRDDDLNQGKRKRGDARYRSPLTEVRWLRVICDEGHGFAGSSCRTNAMAMLDKMYIERRWVVSGTPSSTLHGVEVNLATTSVSATAEFDMGPNSQVISPGRKQSIHKALNTRRVPVGYEQEVKDLERLRLIVVNFLHLQPWANQRGFDDANWKKYLAPTITADGRHRTSPLLRELLQTLIVRHRIEDIDKDLQLPALHSKVVYLSPSYHDKLAINLFGLVLASNFVTSEREDEDYMFHPKNRRKFDLLINNLRQATFHWVGFSEDQVKETLKVSNQYLDENIDKVSDGDGVLLTEAILNGERALRDPSWLAFSKLHEIGVYLEDFPDFARQAWSLDGRASNPTLFGTVQAREAQKFVKDRVTRMVTDVTSGLAGIGVRAMKAAHDRAIEEQKVSRTKTLDGEKQPIGAVEEPKLKASPLISRKVKKDKSFSNIPSMTQKRKTMMGHGDSFDPAESYPSPPDFGTDIDANVPQSMVAGFTSAKLNYLISQLLIHSSQSKSIIFYSHPNTAFFIAEALDLMGLSHRIYASTLSIAQRNSYLQLFNTDDSIRVLLMDLKQAGQGLHIASANRVYIVAPIWEDGVQSQAIKRAHRIGQKRDVYVETLVLKGTFEEELIRRRQEIDRSPEKGAVSTDTYSVQEEKTGPNPTTPAVDTSTTVTPQSQPQLRTKQKSSTSSLLDDGHMIQVLKNIKFLSFTPDEDDEGNMDSRIARMTAVPPEKRMVFVNYIGRDKDKIRKVEDDYDKRCDETDMHISSLSLSSSSPSKSTPDVHAVRDNTHPLQDQDRVRESANVIREHGDGIESAFPTKRVRIQ